MQPIDHAWLVLKADPRMQMFTGPGDKKLPENYAFYEDDPEVKRLRTVNPAIAAMIARNRGGAWTSDDDIVGVENIADMAEEPRDDWISEDYATAMPLRVGQPSTSLERDYSKTPTHRLPNEHQIMADAARQAAYIRALKRGDPIQPGAANQSDIEWVGPGAGITEGASDFPFDIESQIRSAGGYPTATDPGNPYAVFDQPQFSGNYIHPELAAQGIQ